MDRNAERVNLRDATGRLITIPVEEIEEEAEGRSLMPQGLTRLLTRDELLDLVKYLAELGRPGRYALPAAPTIQRWLVAAADGATAAQSPPDKPPAAAAATILAYHDGSLPVAEAAAAARGPGDNGAASPRPPLPAAVVLRGEIAVTQAGPLVLALAGPADARWFLDGRPLEVAGPRAEEIPRTPSARAEFDYGAEGDDAVGCESGERQAVVEREARFNFPGQLGLSFGEVGGLLAVSVVFAFGPALFADGLVAGQLGGAGLECQGGPEVIENGVADG